VPEPPKYRRIEADLRERIHSGHYAPGAVLPPQRRLGDEYGVTLMTIRQALQLLEADGLIAQQAGRGTYVLPRPASHHLQSLRSLADELAAQGVEVHTDVLGRRARALPRDVSAALGAGADARGLRLERLRRVGERPVLHQVSWIPDPWGAAVRDADFTTEPLYAALARVCGLTVARAHETLTPRLLPDRLAETLHRPAGQPVLEMERITFDPDDRPFVADVALVLDPQLRVVTDRRAASVTNTWQFAP
jgi:GntR family transcriptional regulator